MSLKKVNLDKLMREESLISEQEEKARALMLKARDRKQRLVRRRAHVMMDHLEKVNIDGSNIPFLLGAAVYMARQGKEKMIELEKLGHDVMDNPENYKIEIKEEAEDIGND